MNLSVLVLKIIFGMNIHGIIDGMKLIQEIHLRLNPISTTICMTYTMKKVVECNGTIAKNGSSRG